MRTAYAVVCKDLHGGVGLFPDQRKAQKAALHMNMEGMRLKMSGQGEQCMYVALEIIVDDDLMKSKAQLETDHHPGLYL